MLTHENIVFRLLLAFLLGGIVGYERERKGRLAGLRTHILVCLGSTLIMMVSLHIQELFQGIEHADPGRIAAQVVSGIGFLGAGTILRSGASIKGLTTAAGLWAVAGIGLAIGSGFYFAAMLTSVLALAVLFILGKTEFALIRRPSRQILVVESDNESGNLDEIKTVFATYGIEMENFKLRYAPEAGCTTLDIEARLVSEKHNHQVVDELLNCKGIIRAEWLPKS